MDGRDDELHRSAHEIDGERHTNLAQLSTHDDTNLVFFAGILPAVACMSLLNIGFRHVLLVWWRMFRHRG